MAITRLRQLAWFVAIWTGSVAALGLVAYGLRWVLHP
ncbi:DUF2474 family protein [Sphingosinicella sp.]